MMAEYHTENRLDLYEDHASFELLIHLCKSGPLNSEELESLLRTAFHFGFINALGAQAETQYEGKKFVGSNQCFDESTITEILKHV